MPTFHHAVASRLTLVSMVSALAIEGSQLASASIQVLSTERAVGVTVSVNGGNTFSANSFEDFTESGAWSAFVDESYSPQVTATASQSSHVGASGFSGVLAITAVTSLVDDMTSAVANAISRVDVVFNVSRFGLYTLSARYECDSEDVIVPTTTPFLSISTELQLMVPESLGPSDYLITVALQPGVHTFTALAAVGGFVADGGTTVSSGTVSLTYSFAMVPAPGAVLVLAMLGGVGTRRRRRV